MKIVRIFGNHLFAFKFEGEQLDEFHRLFKLWHDPEFLEDFFNNQRHDLSGGYWGRMDVEDAALRTLDYAVDLEQEFITLLEKTEKQLPGLEMIFRPLKDQQYQEELLGKNKAKRTWLRLYALRVESDVYVVTGGAIKLTQTMQEREHTMKELEKIEKCRNYLLDEQLIDLDGIIEIAES